jgi:hypothetical protein
MRSWEAVTFSVTPPPANSRHGRPRKKASGSISSRLEELARPKSVNPRRSMVQAQPSKSLLHPRLARCLLNHAQAHEDSHGSLAHWSWRL